MNEYAPESLIGCFSDLPDLRVTGRCAHKLTDIIVIAICAVIGGTETWVDIETFGKAKQAWFEGVLELPNGIPSQDTFGRVFAALDGEAFQRCFMRWVEGVFKKLGGQVVAIDGKTVRRSHDRYLGTRAIHMVSAWASGSGVVLGQCKVDEKSNEIVAIPALLRLLDVSGCIVTIEAFEFIRHHEGWADLQTIVRVQRERHFDGKVEVETAYSISSLPNDAALLLNATRAH